MSESFVFIYAKKKKIKALSLSESEKKHDSLIAEGWRHTQTLDACVWIEFLCNLCEDVDIINEINELFISPK